jgi:hypothetical protein
MALWPNMETWKAIASLAPILTAFIALCAVLVAYRALRVQREMARKRAAFDFFLKTEMDRAIIDAYIAYEVAIDRFSQHGEVDKLFADSSDYQSVRTYLNIHELVAVGIHSKMLDESVCFSFWSDELIAAYKQGKPLIEHMRKLGTPLCYVDLERLHTSWVIKDAKDRRKRKIDG